ncbi:MAG: sulfite exporter TauE/SafE family protein [Candidatus Bathyarchaeia archaeon]
MELVTVIILFIGGLFSGIINTIVGGGSLISVPLLITSGLPAHLAIGTNRFAMVFNTGVGAIDYHRKVKYKIKLALFLAVFASIGSYLGANIVLQIDEKFLKYIIGILMLTMGGIIVYKKKLGLEERKTNLTRRNYIFLILTAVLSFLIGIYGGFFGAGISTMFTFMFASFFGMSFIKSAGITRFIVSILSIIAVLIFLINMKIDFLFGIILAISFIAGAKIGVKLALKAGNIWIRRLFIFLVVISSIRLLFF